MPNKFYKHLLLAFVTSQHSFVHPLACDFPKKPNKNDLYTTIVAHPAGSINRREWTLNGKMVVYRVEIDGIKSGHVAFNKIKVIYNVINGWGLTDLDGNLILQLGKFDLDKVTNLKIDFENEKWSLQVRRQYVPIILPGIATESEHSLDVTFIRLC